MKSLIFFNTLFGFFTVIALLSSLVLIYLIFFSRKNSNISDLRDFSLIYASLVALVSTTGSLIYSEVIGFIPCTYCWYQRFVMYPLAALLIYVVIKKKFIRLAGLFAGLGGAISIYHIYTQNGGGSGGSPSGRGGACRRRGGRLVRRGRLGSLLSLSAAVGGCGA